MTPRLPEEWEYANLNHVRAFNSDFDIKVNRISGDKLDVRVMKGDKCVLSKKVNEGTTIKVNL